MGDPRGFLKVRTRRELAERPVEERIKDWVYVHAENRPATVDPSAGGPLHGLRHPVLYDRMSAGQPDS